MNITSVLLKINIILNLQNNILTYLSKSQNKILNNNKNIIIEEISKYDPNIIIYCIKRTLYVNHETVKDITSLCAKYGLFNQLKWLKKNKYTFNRETLKYAVLCNDVKIMKWLYENSPEDDYDIFSFAARNGNLEIMKWLNTNYFSQNSKTVAYAAEYGNLTNLKWLIKQNTWRDEYTLSYAAKNGNLENIKWLVENGFPHTNWTFFKALENGNMENLEWLVKNLLNKNDIKFSDRSQAIKYLVKENILRKDNECYFNNAVTKGKLEIMKLLFENGFAYSRFTFSHAVKNGNLENMKWLLKNNISFFWEYTFDMAIYKENLENIKWLYENKCPINPDVLISAIKTKNIDIISWLIENNCPINRSHIDNLKIENIEIIKCLRKYNLYFPIESNINIDFVLKNLELNNFKEIYDDAFKTKKIKNIVVLLRNNIPYDQNSFKTAIKNKLIKLDDLDLLVSYEKKKILKIMFDIIIYN